MHELVELTLFIVRKRTTILKSVFAIECKCRFKRRAGSRFEGEPCVATTLRFGHYMDQQPRGYTFSCVSSVSAHGFDFARTIAQVFQSAAAEDVVAIPQRVETDLRLLQAGPIQCKNMPWRGIGVHALQMEAQEIFNPGVIEVADDDFHGPNMSHFCRVEQDVRLYIDAS